MAKFTIKVNAKRIDGRGVDPDDVAQALAASIDGHEFEAGEHDSVYVVESAEVA